MSTTQTGNRIDEFYAAWNRGDADAVGKAFAADGRYADPLTPSELEGGELREHVRSLLDVVRGLRLTVTRTLRDGDTTAVVWSLDGTWDGTLGPIHARATRLKLEGVDVLELEDDHLRRVRRTFDGLGLADALGLQTIVEPYRDGAMSFGHSLRSWASKEKPGALGMTWIRARNETEKLAIRARARDIVDGFRETPGFIGIVTGFTGLHGFTLTAWKDEEALRLATRSGAHRDAMHAFREDGLSGGVFTSVWEPVRLNRQWTRCPSGHPNDATGADRRCEVCGKPLPPAEAYL